jgi:hypothetical protein
MTMKMNAGEATLVFGGLAIVILAGICFAIFPLYRNLDTSSVRRPVWNPPAIVIRKPGQGLNPADLARLEQDPRQGEFVKLIKEGIIYRPPPSWLGFRKFEPNEPVRGRQFPTNSLLYLFVGSGVGYYYLLKHRGIL